MRLNALFSNHYGLQERVSQIYEASTLVGIGSGGIIESVFCDRSAPIERTVSLARLFPIISFISMQIIELVLTNYLSNHPTKRFVCHDMSRDLEGQATASPDIAITRQ